MPSSSTLALYIVAATVILIVPGPAVLYVVSRAIRHGSRAAVTAVLGIHVGTLAQVAASAAGLSWLLLSSALAFTVVKYAGAAYLIYLGIRALLNRDAGGPAAAETLATAPRTASKSAVRLFGEGILVNVLNPKLALFFLAFLPQFVDPTRGAVTGQIAVFGLVFVLLGLCTDTGYALLAGAVAPWLRRSTRVLNGERYVAGGLFLCLGVVTALTPGRHGH